MSEADDDDDIPFGYMTAGLAMAELGIKKESFYSYISRFGVRTTTHAITRRKLYNQIDVERIKCRSDAKRGNQARALQAMHFGEPIIQTSICEITAEGPFYRGRSAIELARTGWRFESVADLLMRDRKAVRTVPWLLPKIDDAASTGGDLAEIGKDSLRMGPKIIGIANMLCATGPFAEFVPQSDVAGTAILLMQLASGFAGAFGATEGWRPMRQHEWLGEAILRASGSEVTPAAVHAVDAALIIFAEHELTPATLAVRIAASTGAEPLACLIAGLAVEGGGLQGGALDLLEDLLMAAADDYCDVGPRTAIEQLATRIRHISWTSHPIYGRDPRAQFLLELARDLPAKRYTRFLFEVIDCIERGDAPAPGCSFALVVLAMCMDLPPRTASLLRFLARMAGWTAHILEQRHAAFMLRPRAQFVQTPNRGTFSHA